MPAFGPDFPNLLPPGMSDESRRFARLCRAVGRLRAGLPTHDGRPYSPALLAESEAALEAHRRQLRVALELPPVHVESPA